MKYSMKSDKGVVRQTNQDGCFLTVFDDDSCFAVVCDGMGGSKAGEVASEIAVKNISERFVAGWRHGISVSSVKNLLTTAISAANICIFDTALSDSKYEGMGTTAVAVVLLGDNLIVANIGDSRAYSITDCIKQLTKDHSLAQQLVDEGTFSQDDIKYYPYKNVITRALGVEEHIDIDFSEFKYSGKEKILLCSDGLTNFVSEDEILKIISEETIETAAEKLADCANKNGGGDNITAVVFSK